MEQVYLYVFFIFGGEVYMEPGFLPLPMENESACELRMYQAEAYFEGQYPDTQASVGCLVVNEGETLVGNLGVAYEGILEEVAEAQGERM